MNDRDLAKLLTQAGQDPGGFVGTASQMNADGTVTITGANGTVTAIAQTVFRSGNWSAKQVGNTWYAWSENSPVVESESRQVRRSPPSQKETSGLRWIMLLDSNLANPVISVNNQKFLENLFKIFPFTVKKIYTFSDSPGEGISPKGQSSKDMIAFFGNSLTVSEITVAQLGSVERDSVFYLPLHESDFVTIPPSPEFPFGFSYKLNPIAGVSVATKKAIKQIAQRGGVVLQGEHQLYYNLLNNFLLETFYKSLHGSFDFTFTTTDIYNPFLISYNPSTNKNSVKLFNGITPPNVSAFLTGGIPVDKIPEKERLAVFTNSGNNYVGVFGWEGR